MERKIVFNLNTCVKVHNKFNYCKGYRKKSDLYYISSLP